MQPHLQVLTARSRVLHADRYLAQPALISDAWLRLKELQGHPITSERLARIHARPAAPRTCAIPVPPARTMALLSQLRRAQPVFHRAGFTGGGNHGGDAA